ncbi:MAG: sugar phosphate nucleotidyltransferase [Abditibacteriales bacterium]|nr:sugar phosphate nucleotidyltransferase [Abditibacteriales bacterium]MDW8368348.1 sugar phosphate nucleotidyltransferase [Abditibacteriales bacterium]
MPASSETFRAVILAAGKGTRLHPLTATRPKALMPLAGKPLLVHNIERVRDAGIDDITVVIDAESDAIPTALGDGAALNVRLRYVVQEQQLGTAHAVRVAADILNDGRPFMVTFCDNVTFFPLKTLVDTYCSQPATATLALKPSPQPKGGIAEVRDGRVVRVQEGPTQWFSPLVMAGMYIFAPPLWEALEHIPPSAQGEYYLPDAVQWLIDRGHRVTYCLCADWRLNVNRPEEMLAANHYLLEKQTTDLATPNVTPPAFIGKNVTMAPDARVGPYVSIGDGCRIGAGATVADAILFEGVTVGDGCTVRHCILGAGSHVAAGVTIVAVERVVVVGDGGNFTVNGLR